MLKQKFILVTILLLLHQQNYHYSQAFILEGSQTSYAQFRKWYSSPSAGLEFEFWTSQPYGLMLYTDDGGYYDFLEVKLVDGRLRIRLNLGMDHWLWMVHSFQKSQLAFLSADSFSSALQVLSSKGGMRKGELLTRFYEPRLEA